MFQKAFCNGLVYVSLDRETVLHGNQKHMFQKVWQERIRIQNINGLDIKF